MSSSQFLCGQLGFSPGGRTLRDSVGHKPQEFSHLCSEQAGYLSTTYSGQRAAFGVINVQTPLAHPMCALSGLPQSKKATGSEWQVFPGSSLQCGEVSECWEIPAPSPKLAFQLVVPSCDLLSPCLSLSLCLDLAPLRAFLFPTPSQPTTFFGLVLCWTFSTSSLGPCCPVVTAQLGSRRSEPQTSVSLL